MKGAGIKSTLEWALPHPQHEKKMKKEMLTLHISSLVARKESVSPSERLVSVRKYEFRESSLSLHAEEVCTGTSKFPNVRKEKMKTARHMT